MPKSVTTTIAIAVSQFIGGIPAGTAVCVIFVGIRGTVFVHSVFKLLLISTRASRGLAMGAARCAELDFQEGAFSSLALVICGIITSIISTLYFNHYIVILLIINNKISIVVNCVIPVYNDRLLKEQEPPMIARFAPALTAIDQPLRDAPAPLLEHNDFAGWLSAGQVKELLQFCDLDEDALYFSRCYRSLPPVPSHPLSHFNVGAITHAWLRGEKRLRAGTVNYTPCGHCRQFMNELNSGTDLILCMPERPAATLASCLPDAFGPRDLAIQSLLLDEIDHHFAAVTWLDHGLQAAAPADNAPLINAALGAASQSHAPYYTAKAIAQPKP